MNDVKRLPNRTRIILLSALVFAVLPPWSTAYAEPILFLSTQLTPLPEAAMMREVILKDFPQSVDFEPCDRTVYNTRVMSLVSNPSGNVVLGGVQEDFLRLYRAGALASVDDIGTKLPERTFLPGLEARRKLGTDRAYFVPWMQATYLMAANKRALPYLPKGVDLNRLSYSELLEWAANMFRATGKGKLGFPVGPKGLMVRFLQGYLYPSFTGSMSDGFAGPTAASLWQYLRDLWQYVAQSSLILNRMDEALLNGEVWVAWDHTARLLEAFKRQPDDFVAFPAPVGPSGRGFISVLAGLGLPKGSPSAAGEMLIEYLTMPPVQVETMESVGFLPVVEIGKKVQLSKGLSALVQATNEQLISPNAILSTVPLRTADAGRSFDLVYMVAFSRIVLRNMTIESVLERQRTLLHEIETNVRPKDSP
jgi:multiple sugar transport system substrate-binding protein